MDKEKDSYEKIMSEPIKSRAELNKRMKRIDKLTTNLLNQKLKAEEIESIEVEDRFIKKHLTELYNLHETCWICRRKIESVEELIGSFCGFDDLPEFGSNISELLDSIEEVGLSWKGGPLVKHLHICPCCEIIFKSLFQINYEIEKAHECEYMELVVDSGTIKMRKREDVW